MTISFLGEGEDFFWTSITFLAGGGGLGVGDFCMQGQRIQCKLLSSPSSNQTKVLHNNMCHRL